MLRQLKRSIALRKEAAKWLFRVFSGDFDHGIPGNALGGTESGYWKYVF